MVGYGFGGVGISGSYYSHYLAKLIHCNFTVAMINVAIHLIWLSEFLCDIHSILRYRYRGFWSGDFFLVQRSSHRDTSVYLHPCSSSARPLFCLSVEETQI
jgi:hypothetical protein